MYKKKYKYSENLDYKFRRNSYIRAEQVRVIDEEGEFVGVMSVPQALEIAREKELDLIEVAPQAVPPVCKIYEWSKYKYEYSKKHKPNKAQGNQLKEVWLKPLIDVGDLEHKVKKVKEFLEEKHKVKLTVRSSRKTSRLDKKFYFELLEKVLEELKEVINVETPPKLEGRNVYAIIKSSK